MKPALILVLSATLAACQQQPTPKADEPASQGTVESKEASTDAISTFDTSFAGQPAPTIALEKNPDGATETIADIVAANPGQKILVNLWATWCAPCLKELPTLDTLAAQTKGKLVVVPISQDMEGWRKVTPAFTTEKYPNLVTHVESGMKFGFELKAKGLPLTILYDEKGLEIWRYAGDRDWSDPKTIEKMGI